MQKDSYRQLAKIAALIFTVSFVFVLCACNNLVSEARQVQSTSNSNTTKPTETRASTTQQSTSSIQKRADNMQQFIEQEINRAKMLIQPERSKLSLGEAEVILPSAELGALAAIGVQSNDPDVVATIYLFESQASHDAAVEILSAHVPQEGTYILSSSNGPLLCFGYSYIDGTHGEPIDAKYALSDLMQAFAGEEE